MKATTEQLRKLHAIMRKLYITSKEEKQRLVKQISNNRTTSAKELTAEEITRLISLLHLTLKKSPQHIENKLRWKLIYTLRDKGFKKEDGTIDFDKIHDYCQKYWKKNINQMSVNDLRKYISVVIKWKYTEPCQKK